MRLWLSVMGCCVFAYLSWRSVGREVLDTSGKVTSCTGCCGLATSSPRMSPSHHFMPVMHWGGCGWFVVCGALRDVQRAEHCSARGGTWRCASKGSALTLLCHIPLVSAPSGTHIQVLSQDTKRFTKATPRWGLEVLELSSPQQSLPLLAGRHCLCMQVHFSMPLSACPGSLAPELSFYLYFSIPGEDKHGVMRSRDLWFHWDARSFKRAI